MIRFNSNIGLINIISGREGCCVEGWGMIENAVKPKLVLIVLPSKSRSSGLLSELAGWPDRANAMGWSILVYSHFIQPSLLYEPTIPYLTRPSQMAGADEDWLDFCKPQPPRSWVGDIFGELSANDTVVLFGVQPLIVGDLLEGLPPSASFCPRVFLSFDPDLRRFGLAISWLHLAPLRRSSLRFRIFPFFEDSDQRSLLQFDEKYNPGEILSAYQLSLRVFELRRTVP